MGDRRRARRRDRALGRARPRHARAARVRDRGGAVGPHALGRGDRGVERERHGARARRDRRRRARARARGSRSTPSPPRRTGRSRSPRSAPTRSPARPTSGTARTSGSSAPRRRCSRSSCRTSSPRRPTRRPTASSSGTLPFESLAGVTAAAEYMLEVGFDAIRAHEERLLAIAARRASPAIDGVTLYGDPPDRVPTLMFNVAGRTSAEVATALAEREIAVWDGNYYALGARALPRARPARRGPRRVRALQRRRGRPAAGRGRRGRGGGLRGRRRRAVRRAARLVRLPIPHGGALRPHGRARRSPRPTPRAG